ncbi:tRNA lysidine(34) synthetase TilS [Limnobacter sp.]|uniref:tRNA lysidine(34) synthetase TilS n=1 Tax=Limnobacter sp. TaxID=2003368 RepID=UPI003510E9F5
MPQPWVLAFSGGLDSTVLLHALVKAGVAVQALHVNHHLQAAAQDWPHHCRQFCESLGVPLDVLDVTVNLNKASMEAQARNARYQAMGRWMQRKNFALLLCAHHQDDQLETVLIQLLRGQGLRGMAGMATIGGWPVGATASTTYDDLKIGRPLLGLGRQALEHYASQHHLPHIEDPSNNNTDIRRNWVRHELLPSLQQHFPQARAGLLNLSEFFQAHYLGVDEHVAQAMQGVSPVSHQLDLLAWRGLAPPLQAEVLKAWLQQQGGRCSKPQLLELQRQLNLPQGGRRQVCGHWWVRVSKHRASFNVNKERF